MTNSELKEKLINSIVLLNIPGIGRGRYSKLVNKFGSPQAALNSTLDELAQVNGISRGQASSIKKECDFKAAEITTERIIELGWTVCFHDDKDYPQQLLQIHTPPPILFSVGQPLSEDDKLIAIVGTRHSSESGEIFARQLAADLASEGITVVSGMAEGIDSAAHKGALDESGKTIAVWGSSLDHVFPASNRSLAERIKENGTIFSEYLPGTRPDRAYFPERNRIISGLSSGIVVVEAGDKSGALITATHALEQGRELFAVPGNPGAPRSIGVNRLIKQGARLLTSIDDIFEELPLLKSGVLVKKFKSLPDLTDLEEKIIGLFTEGPLQIDQISRETNLPVSILMESILAMELKGVIRELPGKRFVLSEDYQ